MIKVYCDRCGKEVEIDLDEQIHEAFTDCLFDRFHEREIKMPMLCKECFKDFKKARAKFLKEFLESKGK